MAPFYFTSLAGLAALVIVLHSLAWSAQADCPDYKINKGCDTGSCSTGGLLTNYSVPATPFPCGFGNCEFSGVVLLQGMKVTLSPGSSASDCCQKCKSSSKCAVWQWIKTKASGACFIYPEVPALECGSKSSNVGSKCNRSSPPPAPPIGPGCPPYNISDCNSPSCEPTGVIGNYSVPETPFPCGFGTCEFSGTILKGGKKITLLPKDSAEECAAQCSKKQTCKTWQWLKTKAGGECFMYPEGLGPECGSTKYTTNVGIKCSLVCHDPHFVGAHGTHYDFNGEPGKSFCLVSDLRLHMNMKMTGYLDDRTESASLLVGGKAVRTWIRELGILWIDEFGKEHSILLVARSGKETERGNGFLELARADGEALPRMQVGEEGLGAGGLTVRFVSIQKKGVYDIDVYSLRIAGLLDMTVQLRVAHPMLRRPDDAETHISLGINRLESTPAIHGVLGQTYREGREETTEVFSALSSALRKSISADGASGRGFLDGRPADYVASNALTADCRYSGYRGRNLPTLAE